jgi:hypothetical protein
MPHKQTLLQKGHCKPAIPLLPGLSVQSGLLPYAYLYQSVPAGTTIPLSDFKECVATQTSVELRRQYQYPIKRAAPDMAPIKKPNITTESFIGFMP